MNTNKNFRCIAFVLALVMILPLLPLSAFAETVVATIYSNDFEGKTFDSDLDGDGVNDAYKMIANEDSLKDFGDAYIVGDPTGADDDVWRVNMAADANTQITGVKPTYVERDTVFFENDVYVPTGSTGTARWYMYGSGTYADDGSALRTFLVFFDLNLGSAKLVMRDGTEITLKKDVWINLSLAMDMDSGALTLYADGTQVYAGSLVNGGRSVENVKMELLYCAKVDVKGVGVLYVDNLNVFEGSAPSGKLKRVSIFQRDFDGKTLDSDLDGDGVMDAHKLVDSESGFRYDDDEGLNTAIDAKGSTNYHYIMNDPTSNYASNGAWRIPMGSDNGDNWGHILPAMTSAAYQYSKIVVEMDLYIPEGLTDNTTARWRSWGGRDPAGTAGAYYVFMDVNLKTATLMLGGQSYPISKETWHTVSLCIDFESGVVNIYADKVLALTHDLGEDLVIGYFWFAMPDDLGGADYYLWVDNIDIFTGNQPTGGALSEAPLSPIYSNTMEGKRFDTDLDGDGVMDAHKLSDAEGIGNGDDRPNAVIDEYYAGKGETAPLDGYHYFVQDPAGGENDVWKIPMSLANNDSWGHLIAGRDPVSYAQAEKILLENDVYISKDAVGKVNWQIYAGAFKSLFNLNLYDASLYINTNHHSDVSIVGEMQLKQEQWYRLSYVLDLVGGDWSLYVDHVLVATGNINLTNISVTWLWNARLLEATENYTGFLYVDDIKLYAADGFGEIYSEQSADVDGQKPLQYVDVTVNGKSVRTLSTRYLVPAGDESFAALPVYFNDGGEFDGIVSNVGKTSVRYGNGGEKNPAGLRFATEIDLALLAELEQMVDAGTLKQIDLGTLIAPTDYIQTVEGVNTTPIADSLADLTPGETVLDVAVEKGKWFDFDDKENYPDTYFVGSIVNLKVENYDRAFSAAGYVRVTLLSGEQVYLLADVHSADVKTVSAGVLSVFGDQLSDYAKTVLQNYIDGVSNGESVRGKLAQTLKNLNVLAIGDSLFDGDFLSGDQQWIGLLAKECSWNLTNLGQDGWTVSYNPEAYADPAQVRPSMAYHLLNVDKYQYGSTSYYYQNNNEPVGGADTVDLILLEGGLNDYNWGLPLGEVASEDIGTLYGAFNTMIETLLATHPNARIVLVTSWHKTGTRADGAEAMDFVANALKNIKSERYADDERVALVDAGDPAVSGIRMSDADFRAAYGKSVDDSAHLNAKGMELMASEMIAQLAALFENSSSEE